MSPRSAPVSPRSRLLYFRSRVFPTHLDSLVPAVRDLGRRHAEYGLRGAGYNTVGAALLWTLEQGLGGEFTPEVMDACIAAYTILAPTMQQSAAVAAA
jgi:hemoglobin-like flavoprotein